MASRNSLRPCRPAADSSASFLGQLRRAEFDRIRVISCIVDGVTDAAVSEVEEFGPDYFQDPLGFFARVRQQGPVVPVQLPDGGQYWLITRYADVRAALGLRESGASLVRPDGYIAWRSVELPGDAIGALTSVFDAVSSRDGLRASLGGKV